ncbi:MAG: macrolide family glycosyltransferase [Sarcina sp.]
MAKGLFLGFPGHGHVNPTIGLVRELIASGDEIFYYCTEEFRNKIAPTGAYFIPYDAIDPEQALRGEHINSFDHLTSVCNGLLKVLFETKEDSYDYIIYDSMINIGDKIKKLLEIPYSIRSITTFAFSRRLLFDLTMCNLKMIENPKSKDVHKRILEMKEKYNVGFKMNYAKCLLFNKSNINIVYTSSYFQPRIWDFNEKYKFVGPSIANRKENIDFKIENLNDRKIIYISLGTIANTNNNLYQESFKAFKDLENTIIVMSVGSKTDISTLGEIPDNFRVYNYVPQLELLKKVDLFITHGGMNSTSEGLYNNIPLIVIPQFGDQFIVGKRVEALSAGVNIKNEDVSAETLKAAYNKIYANYATYKTNASKVGITLRTSGSYFKAKNEIKNLISFPIKDKLFYLSKLYTLLHLKPKTLKHNN